MTLSRAQIIWIQKTRRKIAPLRDEATWRLLLRNCCVHISRETNEPSLRHPLNGQAIFEEIMYRLSGREESGLDEERWADKAAGSARRLRHSLQAYADQCVVAGLLESGGLEGFVERMTARSEELGEQTRDIGACNNAQLIMIIQGFKAWMDRQASKAGIDPEKRPQFGKKALATAAGGGWRR